jgi:hypothetical protein
VFVAGRSLHHVRVTRDRPLPVLDVLRYAQGASRVDVELDGYLNYHFVTTPPGNTDAPRLMLEAGINPAAPVEGADGARRAVISLRSSPWKAGHVTNPWHDEFDLDHGHVRYYGDHKPTTVGLPGATAGNRALIEAWAQHAATDRRGRLLAPPLLIYRSVTIRRDNRSLVKGHVEFCGAAIIERLEHVVQRDPETGAASRTWSSTWPSWISPPPATPSTCDGSTTVGIRGWMPSRPPATRRRPGCAGSRRVGARFLASGDGWCRHGSCRRSISSRPRDLPNWTF